MDYATECYAFIIQAVVIEEASWHKFDIGNILGDSVLTGPQTRHTSQNYLELSPQTQVSLKAHGKHQPLVQVPEARPGGAGQRRLFFILQ